MRGLSAITGFISLIWKFIAFGIKNTEFSLFFSIKFDMQYTTICYNAENYNKKLFETDISF